MSIGADYGAIYPLMSKPRARSALYRMIEVGQLAHKALLVPLLDRGLEPGDDAVLFALRESPSATEDSLAEDLGLTAIALKPRLQRLIEREIVSNQGAEDGGAAHLALTERGERMLEVLSAHWQQLEEALFAELPDKRRKRFDRVLKRFAELLRLA